jgi:hypothetical protein
MSSQSAVYTEEESAWLSEVAGRLRLIQADAAAGNSQQRREFLSEELARSLKTIPAADRKRRLHALLGRFPVGGQTLQSAVAAPVPPPAPVLPPPKPETFEELLERLLKAAAGLDEKKRTEAGKRLADAGLVRTEKEQPALDISEELQKALGLQEDQQPRLQNMVKLCLMLIDIFQRLDQTALATLRELAPKSSLLKRPQDFRGAAAQFLAGEADTIEPHLRVISSLMGALLAAMLGGGRDFGRQFNERLAPGAIEDVVVGEGGGSSIFGKSKKERCWERYILLSKDYETPDLVDRRIRDCLAAFVERKVLNTR